MGDQNETFFYPGFSSGNVEEVLDAIALIEGSAIMQGLMDIPESDGD
jgi:hypothetical protein